MMTVDPPGPKGPTMLIVKYKWSLVWLLPLLYGCATPHSVKLDPVELPRLRTESEIAVLVRYDMPSFVFWADPASAARWGLALGPLVGTEVSRRAGERARREGEELRSMYSVKNPVTRVRDRLVSELRANLGFQNLRLVENVFVTTDDLMDLRRKLGPSEAVVEFKTTGWGVTAIPKFIPFTTERYRIVYRVRCRLIDFHDPRILWEDFCESFGRHRDASWTMEELTAQSGTLLKEKIDEAADTCAEELSTRFSGQEAK